MTRQISIIILLISTICSVTIAADQVQWTGKGGDTSWTNPANWDSGKVPGPHDIIILNSPSGRGVVIDTDIQCGEMRGPVWKSNDDHIVDVVGCNVTIEGWWRWANRGRGQGTININRANVDVQGMFRLSDSGKTFGVANITDSVLKCKGVLIGDGGNGQINMKGNVLFEVEESVNMGGSPGDDPRTYEDKPLRITMDGGIFRIGETLMCPSDKDRAGTASIELTAGRIECKSFSHDDSPYSMNIEEGVLIISGDVTADMKKDIESGYITAFGGKETVVCRYFSRADMTIVMASGRKKARRPSPRNRVESVKPDVKLKWRAGRRDSKNTYDLYIGTSLDAVGPDAKPVAKGLAEATFDPDLDFSKTYHWRVDVKDEAGAVHKGTTWQFNTTDGKAFDPTPTDKTGKIASNTTLTWKPGLAADSSNIYIGKDPDKLEKVTSTSASSFKPDGLELGETYHWRVDGINTAWKQSPWKGQVWSFSVDSGKATDPKPIDGAQWKPTEVTLNWSAARTASSHMVYFGESADSMKKVTTTRSVGGTKVGPLKEGTTYYWRVDELSSGKVVKGDIWKFSTVGMLDLKVDLAVPQWYDRTKPRPGTVKPGWYALCSPAWADMYMHDGVWFPIGKTTPDPAGILGSGVQLFMDNGKGGNGAIMGKGLCRGGLAGDLPIYGIPEGDPIANTYFYACDWAGQKNGDAFVLLKNLPAGEYEMTSYHNHWEPTTQGTRNCHHSESAMPPMPSVSANPVPIEALPDYGSWSLPKGTGKGVVSLQEARNIKVTSVLSDDEVTTSLIKFSTDGSDVLIIYEAPDNTYRDRARSGRNGARGIWNAFELKMVSWAK